MYVKLAPSWFWMVFTTVVKRTFVSSPVFQTSELAPRGASTFVKLNNHSGAFSLALLKKREANCLLMEGFLCLSQVLLLIITYQ